MSSPVMVTFVCWGNICRSPSARVVFERLVAEAGLSDQIIADSSGTGNWHIGHAADEHARKAGEARGYDMTHKAKQFQKSDLEVYDLVVALDADRADEIKFAASSPDLREKVVLLRSFDPDADQLDVPDPFQRGDWAFEEMFEQIEPACKGLLAYIKQNYL